MKNVGIFMLGLLAGAAGGSLVTWKLIEKKYKDIADEEIESVKKEFNINFKDRVEESNENVVTDESVEELTNDEYNQIVTDLGYGDNVSLDDEDDVYTLKIDETEQRKHLPFHLISPEEYGDEPGFSVEAWTYYSDGVVEDEMGDVRDDYKEIIGDAPEHFGEYADNAVYIRNNIEECDYELLKCDEPYHSRSAI